jgi:replicative DNA helicase
MKTVNKGPKMMPHNIEAEQAVLGSVLIDSEAPIGILF